MAGSMVTRNGEEDTGAVPATTSEARLKPAIAAAITDLPHRTISGILVMSNVRLTRGPSGAALALQAPRGERPGSSLGSVDGSFLFFTPLLVRSQRALGIGALSASGSSCSTARIAVDDVAARRCPGTALRE